VRPDEWLADARSLCDAGYLADARPIRHPLYSADAAGHPDRRLANPGSIGDTLRLADAVRHANRRPANARSVGDAMRRPDARPWSDGWPWLDGRPRAVRSGSAWLGSERSILPTPADDARRPPDLLGHAAAHPDRRLADT